MRVASEGGRGKEAGSGGESGTAEAEGGKSLDSASALRPFQSEGNCEVWKGRKCILVLG